MPYETILLASNCFILNNIWVFWVPKNICVILLMRRMIFHIKNVQAVDMKSIIKLYYLTECKKTALLYLHCEDYIVHILAETVTEVLNVSKP